MADIIGQDADGYYLIDLGMGTLYGNTMQLGQVYYKDEKKLYAPNMLAELQGREEWEPYTGEQSALKEWMRDATFVPDPTGQLHDTPEGKSETTQIETM